MRRRILLVMAIAIGALAPTSAAPVEAAFPGKNGKIIMDVNTHYLPGAGASQYGPEDPYCDLWTVNPDGSNLTNLTTGPGCEFDGAWSPDGSKIAFESNRTGDHDIYVMDENGDNVTRLTRWAGDELYPVWSPNGRRIVFLSDRSRGTDIVVMRADGSNKKVVGSVRGSAWETSWSPTGPKILFTLEESHLGHYNTDDDEDIYVLNLRTGRIRPVIATPQSEFTPAWSPDGRRIAFAAAWCAECGGRGDIADIYVADADGSDPVQLTDSSPSFAWNPAWSPDGKRIVYATNTDETYTNFDLFVMDPLGENVRPLLFKPESFDAAPDWQPLP